MMRFFPWQQAAPLATVQGRTWQGEAGLHFNWSCSGFTVTMQGGFLAAELTAFSSEEYEGAPGDTAAPHHTVWPWVAVFVDGADAPTRTFEVTDAASCYLLFRGDEASHTVRVVKLTENLKSGLCLHGLWVQGNLQPAPQPPRKTIEYIGDSITCGFGNATKERDRLYYAQDENAWLAHGPLAARLLGMDWQMLSISGICLTPHASLPMPFAMEQLYEYTDLPGQQAQAPGSAPQRWNFAARPADYIVLNLGTNDANAAALADDGEKEVRAFRSAYAAFLQTLRRLNGPNAQIVCALGSMDYYLYPEILAAVAEYRAQSGDTAVSCLRYLRISPADPLGACAHPHLVTHAKMARQLAAHIRALENAE